MKWPYRLGWLFFHFLFKFYFRWKIYHPERVPQHGPVLIAGNHASFLDPPLIGAAVYRELCYLARASLFRFPGANKVLRSWNAIPLNRDRSGTAGMLAVLDRLQAGDGTIVFPEGTRTSNGQLQPPQTGIGLIVIKSTAPVVPVRLFGTYEAFGRHMRFPRPRRVAIKFGSPLDFAALREESKTCSKPRLKEIYQEIAASIMEAIARLEPGEDD